MIFEQHMQVYCHAYVEHARRRVRHEAEREFRERLQSLMGDTEPMFSPERDTSDTDRCGPPEGCEP